MVIKKLSENLVTDRLDKKVYFFYDENGKRIHKSREYNLKSKSILVYPYYYRGGTLTYPKIRAVELRGWEANKLPKDLISKKWGPSLSSKRVKTLMAQVKRRFKQVNKLIIGTNVETSIKGKVLTFSWDDMRELLVKIEKVEKNGKENRSISVDRILRGHFSGIKVKPSVLQRGQLNDFLELYEKIDSLNDRDIEAIERVFTKVPKGNVKVTDHFLQTRQTFNKIYIEDIVSEFKVLLNSKTEREESWQRYFEDNAWVLNHLFPYQVIIRKAKAYLGGTTVENKNGKIVDFLFQSGFKDNHALLEIKTHLTPLMRDKPYRGEAAFATTEDLAGSVSQCLDYKDHLVSKEVKDVAAYDPACILIIGKKSMLSSEQIKSFELFRSNQKNVVISTFDELLEKLEALLLILTRKK